MFGMGKMFGGASPPRNARSTLVSGAAGTLPDVAVLDITYITHRIIAMGAPTTGRSDPEAHLNNVDDLTYFLQEYHSNHLLVWHLGAAPGNTNKKFAEKVKMQVLNVPWESSRWRDAEDVTIPVLPHMFRLCYTMHAWLELHEENVAAVFGVRDTSSALFIACYLRFCGEEDSSVDAFRRVLTQRQKSFRLADKALDSMPPSIRSYLMNFDTLITQGAPPETSAPTLLSMSMQGLPRLADGAEMWYEVWDGSGRLFSSKLAGEDDCVWNPAEGFVFGKMEVTITGDFEIILWACLSKYHSAVPLLSYANCAGFLVPGSVLNLSPSELDILKGMQDYSSPDMLMTLCWDEVDERASASLYSGALEEMSGLVVPLDEAAKLGVMEITSMHCLTASMRPLDQLLSMGYDPEQVTLALQLCANNADRAASLIEVRFAFHLQALLPPQRRFDPHSLTLFAPPHRGRPTAPARRSLQMAIPGHTGPIFQDLGSKGGVGG
jgi:hypothetical protein